MTERIYRYEADEAMRSAQKSAILSFKYFWRELSWESRRIIPGLDMHAVKVPIKTNVSGKDVPSHEHMWFSNIYFDGKKIYGELLNQPLWVKKLKQGDQKDFELNEIEDWIYSINDYAYGGFTVNIMRASMSKKELKQHDDAWGLKFGDAKSVFVVPKSYKSSKGAYQIGDNIPEHPMSLNMNNSFEKEIRKNPKPFLELNDEGYSMLHFDSLAGNISQVKTLLKCGANKSLKNKDGLKPIDLARIMKWETIIDLLK